MESPFLSSAKEKMMEVSSNTTRVDDGGGHRHAGFAVQEESGHEIEEKNELLLKALTVEREAQAALYHELEKERNAAATAANEAMAMITRLQEEKALVQMEARQYQRMVEEKTMYDQEAMEVLKEVIARHEEEKNELEEEIRICKRKLRLCAQQVDEGNQAMPEPPRNAALQHHHPAGLEFQSRTDTGRRRTTTTKRQQPPVTRVPPPRQSQNPQDAEFLSMKRRWSFPDTTQEEEAAAAQQPEAAGIMMERELEEKRLSVLEYVCKFEEQLHHQQGSRRRGSAAAQTGRPQSAGESRSKMRTQEGRTGSSESSRKVISRIVEEEDNPLCRWLFQEGVVMGRNHLDPSSSLMEREDNSGTGKLEEESESQGMDDETLGLMMGGEHAEEEECGEEEELFIQDIYEVHNAPHQPRGVVLQEDIWDSQEWNSEIRHLSNSDRLGKPDLLILHEEEETPEDGVGEGTYYPERRNNEVPSKDEVGSSGIDRQWEGFCDDNIRSNSSTISRDSACRVPVEDEVMHLTLRLKALEADRNLMKQTIESLRRENGEMKLLQEIAQQLRELRGLEQKDLQQQSKPLAAASPCQGMMSFAHLCNSAQTQLSKLACVCLGNSSTMDYPGESRIGLGHLLHSSPKPSTCVTQLRRANIPSTLSAIQSMALQPQETSNQPLQSG